MSTPHFSSTQSSTLPLRSRKTHASQRGLSLATMLAFLAIMALVGGASIALINTSLRIARRQIDTTEALNIADAGVDLGYTWLTLQDPPPSSTSVQSMTNFFGTNGTINAPFGQTGTQLVVRIRADVNNPTSTQKRYLVESKGIMPSGATVTVRAFMQQVSFGKYAFFTVNDGDGFWDYTNHFEGPFHSNDGDGKQTMIRWKTGQQADPMFQHTGTDAFSVSGDVTWWKDSIGNTVAPSSSTDFTSLAAGGQATMTYGFKTDANGNFLYDTKGKKIPNSPSIPLPDTNYAQQYAAIGLIAPVPATSAPPDTSLPTAEGVTYTPGGGLYIKTGKADSTKVGDNDIVLQVDSSGNQQLVVTEKSGSGQMVQTVTINPVANTTSIKTVTPSGATTTTVQSGVPNGMVYSDGNITNLSGTIANNRVSGSGSSAVITYRSAMTITTDLSHNRDIYIADDIKYQVTRDYTKKQLADTNFNLYAGTLGILTNTAVVRTGAASTHGYNLRIDGSIFANDTFKPQTFNGFLGSMTEMGGVIVKNSGIFATANSTGITGGYNEVYHYDNRLADNPPPFFPTTGNDYDIVSWQRVTNTL